MDTSVTYKVIEANSRQDFERQLNAAVGYGLYHSHVVYKPLHLGGDLVYTAILIRGFGQPTAYAVVEQAATTAMGHNYAIYP